MTSDYDFEREYDARLYDILRKSSELRKPTNRKKVSKPKKIKEMYITSKASSSASKKNNAYRVQGIGEVYLQSKPDYEQIEYQKIKTDQNEPAKRRLDMDINEYGLVDNIEPRKDESKTVLTTIGLIGAISRLSTTTTTSDPPIDDYLTTTERSLVVAPIVEKIISFMAPKSNNAAISAESVVQKPKLAEQVDILNSIDIPSISESNLDNQESKNTQTMSLKDIYSVDDYTGFDDSNENVLKQIEDIDFPKITSKLNILPFDANEENIKFFTIESEHTSEPYVNTIELVQIPTTTYLPLPLNSFPDVIQTTENCSTLNNPEVAINKQSLFPPFIINELQFPNDNYHVDLFVDNQQAKTNTSIKPTETPILPPSTTVKSRLDYEEDHQPIVFVEEEDPFAPPSFIADFQNYQTSLSVDDTFSAELTSDEYEFDRPHKTTTGIENLLSNELVEVSTFPSDQIIVVATTTSTIEDEIGNEVVEPTEYGPAKMNDITEESTIPISTTSKQFENIEDTFTEQTSTPIFDENTHNKDGTNQPDSIPDSIPEPSDPSQSYLNYKIIDDDGEDVEKVIDEEPDAAENRQVNEMMTKISRFVSEAQDFQPMTTYEDEAILLTTETNDERQVDGIDVGIENNSPNSSTSDELRVESTLQEEDNTFTPNVRQQIDDISARISEIMESAVIETDERTQQDKVSYVPYVSSESPDIQNADHFKSTIQSNTEPILDRIAEPNVQIAAEPLIPEPSARNLADNAVEESIYRRSDVLAQSEYGSYEDYDPTDNDPSTSVTIDEMTGLNQLKLIPLIPVLIEQLRLGRVNTAEKEILQQIFGPEFWQLILSEVESNTSLTEMNATLAKIMREKQQAEATLEPSVMLPGLNRRKRSPTFRRMRNERRRQRLLVQRLQLEASRLQASGRWNNVDDRGLTVNIGLNDGYGLVGRRPPAFYLN